MEQQVRPARRLLDRLLRPRSVAIVGVSSKPGSLGGDVLDNLERFGFAGDIHLVHAREAEVRGRRCVRSTADLPEGVDCVVLAIPAAGVLEAVRGCASRKVGGVIIFAAGFAEQDADGRAAQAELAAISRATGMVIEGPNCLGTLNYADGIPLSFSATEPHPLAGPGIAVVSQSGIMAAGVRAALHGRGLDVSLSVSTGNEAASGVEDYVEYLVDHDETRVIVLVVEHFRQGRRFLDLARRAHAAGKPIVLLHPGKSGPAREAARTHTGAMAGDHAVMRTLAEAAGVLVADTLEELIDLSECLQRCRQRPFGGVSVLGESGALRALILDYCEEISLVLPQPEGQVAQALASLAPGLILPVNPLDLTAQALVDPSLYARALAPLLEDPRSGAVLLAISLTSPGMAKRKMPPLLDLIRTFADRRALIFAMLGDDAGIGDAYIDAVRALGVPFFRSPERALRALARLSAWAARPVRESAPVPAGEPLPLGVMPEYASKSVLEAAGVPMPPRILAPTVEAAGAAAESLGYPVALKAQAPGLPHKSDVGGVVLNLRDPAALAEGWEKLNANIAAAAPGIALDGVLVERMASAGTELILGARNDPDWGPVLAVGLGGVFAEALGDVRLVPADAEPADIVLALRQLKSAKVLGPFRGAAARDVTAVGRIAAALGAFMRAHPEVAEVDINPLMVFAEGEGALPLDALIVVR
ncbi:acetate--CoA ligase family protein [Xanthobacter sp. YC-JY1]|uniref:acetate--CoA ligase family protein n=1 Tax=Xanthobacter sp. YC-JY1 TaxID=2419844 RepID=UPI001F3AB67D|nr:acetate--CoA ligase family protein [Xanthobacter sp. YC-JY1]